MVGGKRTGVWIEVEEETEEGHDCDAQAEGQGNAVDPVNLRFFWREVSREKGRDENIPRDKEDEADCHETARVQGEQNRRNNDGVADCRIQVPRIFPKMQSQDRSLDRRMLDSRLTFPLLGARLAPEGP